MSFRNYPPTESELDTVDKKKRKNNSGKKWGVAETNDDEGTQEDDTSAVDVKPAPKGTITTHFIKFVNELLDIMDEDESLKNSYLVVDNARIHKSKPMIRKIEVRDYRVMYLPPYSPELNPIEQSWVSVKGKMMKEETLSSRNGDAYNDVRFSDLYSFCLHSKRQIINCYKRTPL